MSRFTLWTAVLAVALCGCSGIDYEARGDQQFQAGDYAAAYDSYAAVPADTATPELPRKKRDALAKALDDFVDRATRALDDGRNEEALRIAREGQKYERDDRLVQIEKRAKRKTIDSALDEGRIYLERGEFETAIEKFETARQYSDDPEITRLLLEAKSGQAKKLAQMARQYADANEFDQALDAIVRAITLHNAPEHQSLKAEIQNRKAEWINAQYTQKLEAGRQLYAQKDWAQAAVELRAALQLKNEEPARGLARYCSAMNAGMGALGSQSWRDAIEQFKTALETGHDQGEAQARLEGIAAQRSQFVQAGNDAVAGRDWKAALAAYRSARSIEDDPGVTRWMRYCTAMHEAEALVNARQFEAAEEAFGRAVATGADDGGYAKGRLAAVKPSTWTLTFTSVTAMPFKADNGIWDGALTKMLPLERIMAGYKAGKPGKEAAETAENLIPLANKPDLVVRFTLPDGKRYVTKPAEDVLFAKLNASFSVTTSAYDEREVLIEVLDDDSAGRGGRHGRRDPKQPAAGAEPMGEMRVKLGELLGQGDQAAWRFGQVYSLTATLQNRGVDAPVAPVSGADYLDGGAPAPPVQPDESEDVQNHAKHRSRKRDGCERWKIRLLAVVIAPNEIDDEGGEGKADPKVVITQGDEAVFEHTLGENTGGHTWKEPKEQPRTVLWVKPGEGMTVTLLDVDKDGDDVVLTYDLKIEDLQRGEIRLETAKGSRVVFRAKKG